MLERCPSRHVVRPLDAYTTAPQGRASLPLRLGKAFGGFEGFGTVREPFDTQRPPVAGLDYLPEAPRDRRTAGLALHLAPHLADDGVSPGFEEFAVLIGAPSFPWVASLDVEVPDSLGTARRLGLRPVSGRD